jgi:SNF2 family DNA or RNA helicase
MFAQKAIAAYNESAPKEYQLHALKIDGSTSLVNRFKMIQRFNDPKDKINVMLMSTRAGSEGVNLVGGNRMILFDVCWNPSHDRQAMCRSYRFGQIRPTYVYRLVAAGTVESKILDLQMSKEKLARTIIDDVMTSNALEGCVSWWLLPYAAVVHGCSAGISMISSTWTR